MKQDTARVRICEAREALRTLNGLTGQSSRRFDEIAQRFELFAQRGYDIDQLNEITQTHIEQFVWVKAKGAQPSVSTMHLRRSTLRVLFRVARLQLGFDGDPTMDVALPPKSGLKARPLTDDEIALGRSFSLHTLVVTRQPAAWALGEATATTAELPHLVVGDLDLDNSQGPRVWLHGSRKREPRWGLLDDWGATQLERRAKALRGTDKLIYQGSNNEEDGQRSCCLAISETLARAGLATEPEIRPASLVAWVGRTIFDETHRIDEVAQRLGIRSLDAAARFINLDWR